MVKIRLSKHGRKNAAFYKIVAAEARDRREGKPLEVLGFWNPIKRDLKIDKKRLDDWIQKGAQITTGVSRVLDQK